MRSDTPFIGISIINVRFLWTSSILDGVTG